MPIDPLEQKRQELNNLLEKIKYVKPYEAATLSQDVEKLMAAIRREEFAQFNPSDRGNEA